MKARVIATGDIVELIKIENDCNGIPIYKNISKSFFGQSELDFDHVVCDDYWEKLLHQYAGMALQGILTNEKMMLDLHRAFGKDESMDITVSEFAIDIANTLVKKLKSESNG